MQCYKGFKIYEPHESVSIPEWEGQPYHDYYLVFMSNLPVVPGNINWRAASTVSGIQQTIDQWSTGKVGTDCKPLNITILRQDPIIIDPSNPHNGVLRIWATSDIPGLANAVVDGVITTRNQNIGNLIETPFIATFDPTINHTICIEAVV